MKKLILFFLTLLFALSYGLLAQAEEAVQPIMEPAIRVGIAKMDKPITFVSPYPYYIYSGDAWLGVAMPEEKVQVSYQGGMYFVEINGETLSSPDFIRLRPDDPSERFTITNLTRTLSGHKGINYNMYRGTLEYRFSPKSDMPYLINELPLELYVAGITETAPKDPTEYVKALLVAARTYAYTHISLEPATEKRLFDVYATTQDQLYLGYNSELRLPEAAELAQATAGEMVVYNDAPVITLYFGHSNGKTKTWPAKQKRPWLTSVEAKYDKGKKQWGHGYGMSAHDARERARRDGWTYDQILKYYYTGTEVERIY